MSGWWGLPSVRPSAPGRSTRSEAGWLLRLLPRRNSSAIRSSDGRQGLHIHERNSRGPPCAFHAVTGMSHSTRSLLPPSARRRLKSSLTHLPHPPRSGSGRVVVLCYHSVHPSKEFSSATPELFADQIAWLKDNCRLVSFSEVLRHPGVSHNHER